MQFQRSRREIIGTIKSDRLLAFPNYVFHQLKQKKSERSWSSNDCSYKVSCYKIVRKSSANKGSESSQCGVPILRGYTMNSKFSNLLSKICRVVGTRHFPVKAYIIQSAFLVKYSIYIVKNSFYHPKCLLMCLWRFSVTSIYRQSRCSSSRGINCENMSV